MALQEVLRTNKKNVLDQWLDAIFQTYPLETVGFMRSNTDQFDNPVRHKTVMAAEHVLDCLLEDALDTEKVEPWVDELIRLRAVQEFTAARAVGIVYLLKGILRKMLDKSLGDAKLARELLQFESKIDSLALISFDIYSKCRQQIFELRVNEVKNSQASLLRRAKMVLDTSAEDTDPSNP